jgi:DNA helicase-2/ATP-dependent DNA helicase PcrA
VAAEIEEERRLLYVAMTRARQHLQLVVPQRFHLTQQAASGARHVYASLSRFVPPGVAEHFERLQRETPPEARPLTAAAGAPEIDLAARVRSLWA